MHACACCVCVSVLCVRACVRAYLRARASTCVRARVVRACVRACACRARLRACCVVRACVGVCRCACVRVLCVRASVRVRACASACVRVRVVRACGRRVRACVRACVHVCAYFARAEVRPTSANTCRSSGTRTARALSICFTLKGGRAGAAWRSAGRAQIGLGRALTVKSSTYGPRHHAADAESPCVRAPARAPRVFCEANAKAARIS